MSWRTTPVSLPQSNDLQLEIQKRRFYLKNVALDFVFGFEAIPHPSCYLTSIMNKTHDGWVSYCSFFCETLAAFLATSEVFL